MQLLAAAGSGDGAVLPDCGEIVVADGVRIVSFDQRRERSILP